ncbi:Tc5 transposase DNA-binding domain [Popillia japonica]|uniref:Tc5 transposase DNA-binding domain n=1 Tax=Popillia japonica TaxID=7064 RepID=A0AAW1IAF8_POPJA
MASEEKKYVSLTLNEKVNVVQAIEEEKLSVLQATIKFRRGKTQIYNTLPQKDTVISESMASNGKIKRKDNRTGNEEINKEVLEWFVRDKSKGLPISGTMLQSQALNVAKKLGNATFKASSGWLDCFKSRRNIVWN